MTLNFSQQINGKPNLFAEKILASLLKVSDDHNNFLYEDVPSLIYDYGEYANYNTCDDVLYVIDNVKPKIHTIREDKNNRLQVGTKIHFTVGNRTKNRFQFAPIVPVVSVQDIWIIHTKNDKQFLVYNNYWQQLTPIQVENLAINDGFDSVDDFWAFFNKDFMGKIIHWTDFRYF